MAGKNDRRWTDAEVETMSSMHESGSSIEEIAVALNRTTNSIRNKLKREGNEKWEPINPGKYVVIDGEKMRNALFDKKLRLSTVSEECGYSNGSLSNWLRHNYIPKAMSYYLTTKYGFNMEDFQILVKPVEEEPEEEPAEEEEKKMATSGMLFMGMETAFYKAMIKAFERFKPEVEEMIYRAVIKAEEQAYTEKKEV